MEEDLEIYVMPIKEEHAMINLVEREHLREPILNLKINQAFNDMGSFRFLNPDGFPNVFYKN